MNTSEKSQDQNQSDKSENREEPFLLHENISDHRDQYVDDRVIEKIRVGKTIDQIGEKADYDSRKIAAKSCHHHRTDHIKIDWQIQPLRQLGTTYVQQNPQKTDD